MADWKQNNFMYGDPRETFTDEDAAAEFARISEQLRAEAERIELPDALRAEEMIKLLDGVVPGETKPVPVVNLRREYAKWIAVAACFVLVITGFARMVARQNAAYIAETASSSAAALAAPAAAAAGEVDDDPAEAANEKGLAEACVLNAQNDGDLRTAESYTEIYTMLTALVEREKMEYGVAAEEDAVVFDGEAKSRAEAPMAPVVTNSAAAAGDVGAGYTSTNVQVEGVDEADILKTDGEYLYHFRTDLSTGKGKVEIVRAADLTHCAAIDLPELRRGELYLAGDRLIVAADCSWDTDAAQDTVGRLTGIRQNDEVVVPDWYERDVRKETSAGLFIYDIGDRTAPRRIATFKQSGRIVSSRLSKDVLYLVSNQWVDPWYITGDTDAASVFPSVSSGGEAAFVPAGDIYLPAALRGSANYCIVTAYNIRSAEASTRAVLGSVDTIMMTGDTLLLASAIYDEAGVGTGITRFAVGGGDLLQYRSSGRVPGRIDNQFSLDVNDGLLRVATTDYSGSEPESGVYVYDEGMKLIGSVGGIAPGERIYSVRFLDDTAYVVTFRETDPLFAIDLSDPRNPTVLGQLKIPGFSEYLHPAGEGLLIGVGQNTRANAWGGVIADGLKLALFDVSDPGDPKEITSVLIGNAGSYTEVLENHKAFLWDGQNGRFGFPATVCRVYGATADNPWGTQTSVTFDGYLVYSFDDKEFTRIGELASESGDDPFSPIADATIRRAAVIGDTIYTAAENGMTAWSYGDFAKRETLRYS